RRSATSRGCRGSSMPSARVATATTRSRSSRTPTGCACSGRRGGPRRRLRCRSRTSGLRPGVRRLRGLDLEDLVLHRATWSRDLDGLALFVADDRLADGRLIGELVLGWIRLRGADDVVLDGLLGAPVAQLHLGADRDDILGDVLLVDDLRVSEALLEHCDPVLEQSLLVLRVVVLCVLGDVAELARDADPLRDLATLVVGEVLDLRLELLVSLRSEDDFLQN